MHTEQAIPCFNWFDASTVPRAVLLCIHGLGLHAGAFRTLGERLSHEGIISCAIDVRGFGAWNNGNVCRLDFAAAVDDLSIKIHELKNKHGQLSIFLLGESLGGAIAMRFIAKHPRLVDGLITSAPVRRLSSHKLEFLRALGQFLLHPQQPINLSPHIIKHAPHVVAVNNDRLFRMRFSAAELLHLCHFLEESYQCATKVTDTPVLVVQGHSDNIVDSASTLAFFDRLKCNDKSLVVFGEADHLIFQTHDVPSKAIQLVQDWIGERLPPCQPAQRQAG